VAGLAGQSAEARRPGAARAAHGGGAGGDAAINLWARSSESGNG
jgi:hypothetical protein